MLVAMQVNPRTSRAWCVKAAVIVACWVACFYGTFFGLQSFAVHPRPLSDACHLHYEQLICSQGFRCCGWQQQCTAGALQAARLLGRCSTAQRLVTGAVLRHRPLPLQASALPACMHAVDVQSCWTVICLHRRACRTSACTPCLRRHRWRAPRCCNLPGGCHA